jgi:phosphoribosylglycinamide formyltransferase 1
MRAIVEARTGIAVKAVISNRPGAAGLEWAKAQGLATQVVDHRQFATREAFDAALGDAIAAHSPDLILLAGFMRILTPAFIERFPRRILNIHPSLLPSFPGLHTHARALAAGVKLHGCSVHVVTPSLDSGPIVIQAAVPVLPGDDEEALSERVLAAEHRIYPQAVRWFVEGRVEFDVADVVRIRASGVSSDCIVSPRNAP